MWMEMMLGICFQSDVFQNLFYSSLHLLRVIVHHHLFYLEVMFELNIQGLGGSQRQLFFSIAKYF